MPYPESIDNFSDKLNKSPTGNPYVVEERIPLPDGSYDGDLQHDNINNQTIRVYTGSRFTGEEVTNWTLSIPGAAPWRRSIKIYSSAPEVYVTYETPGDTVEADDINAVQHAIMATQTEVERYKGANDVLLTDARSRLTTVETKKADKTQVDTLLLAKADKATTYTKTETDSRIQAVVAAAPEALDTLKEIADALNNDPDFAGTMTTQLAGKVDKVSGKGLSANDYTAADKAKLAGVEAGANKYTHPANHPPSIIVQDASNRFVTDTEKAAWTAKETPAGAQAKADAAAAGVAEDLAEHVADEIRHITAAERSAWNSKAPTTVVTQAAAGLMSAADKTKLDGVAAGANNYTHPATHPPSIIVQDASNRFVSDGEKTSWNAKASTAPATTSAAGLMPAADKAKLDGIAAGAQVNAVTSVAGRTGAVTVSKTDIGLGNVENLGLATQAEAEAGTSAAKYMTPQRTMQAIASQLSNVGGGDMLKSVYDTNGDGKVDQATQADSVPWSGVAGKPAALPAAGGTADAINLPDTRAVVDKPSDLQSKKLTGAFKAVTAVGNPPVSASGTYVYVLNVVGWSSGEGSGGWPVQIAVGGNGLAYRQGVSADAWGSWVALAKQGPLTWNQLKGV